MYHLKYDKKINKQTILNEKQTIMNYLAFLSVCYSSTYKITASILKCLNNLFAFTCIISFILSSYHQYLPVPPPILNLLHPLSISPRSPGCSPYLKISFTPSPYHQYIPTTPPILNLPSPPLHITNISQLLPLS